MRILALIDDSFIYNRLVEIINNRFNGKVCVDYRFSYNIANKTTEFYKPINIKNDVSNIIANYDLVFSLCSQVFPKQLVENVRCINFHFGILPYACGVAPITFSIVNNIQMGVTIHLMNERIDDGDIIYQEEIEANAYDTAGDVEQKCQKKLLEILDKNILNLVYNKYNLSKAKGSRTYFSLNDFNSLRKINLENKTTAKEIINLLRAFEFNRNNGAYYISESGDVINISIKLTKIGSTSK